MGWEWVIGNYLELEHTFYWTSCKYVYTFKYYFSTRNLDASVSTNVYLHTTTIIV